MNLPMSDMLAKTLAQPTDGFDLSKYPK